MLFFRQSVRLRRLTTDMQSGHVCEHTKFMWHSESCLKAVVLYDWAASFGVTHSANISYTQSVTILISANILRSKKERDKWANETERYETKKRVRVEERGTHLRHWYPDIAPLVPDSPFFPQASSCQQNIFVSVSIVKWSKYTADCVLEKSKRGNINCEIAGPHSTCRPKGLPSTSLSRQA